MVRILLYGYTTGVYSSRAIERKCLDDLTFRWLAEGAAPDYRSIVRFRKRHLSARGCLFVEVLAFCRAAGMVRLRRVALDGTRVRDNASTRKVMSPAGMPEAERVLAEKVWALLADAESIDQAEGATWGKSSRGDAPPERLRQRETRLATLRNRRGALGPWLGSRSGSGPL
jgi:hypothetical protein